MGGKNLRKVLGLIVLSLLLFSCGEKKNVEKNTQLVQKVPKESVSEVLSIWNEDSTGCFGLRIKEKDRIKTIIDQFGLIGSIPDSVTKYLGNPNYVNDQNNSREVFIYFMECPKEKQGSLSNLYLHFVNNQLDYFSTPVF